jgi:hypothetical protein
MERKPARDIEVIRFRLEAETPAALETVLTVLRQTQRVLTASEAQRRQTGWVQACELLIERTTEA